MENSTIRWIYIPCKDKAEALKISKEVIRLRLAACANLLPETTAVYLWENLIVEETECILILKTTHLRVNELEAKVRELHSYETPCFLSFAPESVNDDYLQWIFQNTKIEE